VAQRLGGLGTMCEAAVSGLCISKQFLNTVRGMHCEPGAGLEAENPCRNLDRWIMVN
jgi:hypothetical protein